MPKKILFILCGVALFYFLSCASQPSTGEGGGGGSTSSTGGIVISPDNPSQTLQTVPDLKLKLKDLPDSLSDNDLKLKSIRKKFKAIGDVSTLDPATLPDVKSSAWYSMVDTLQRESTAQMYLTMLKQLSQYYQIAVGKITDLGDGIKVYCANDGKGGLEYYFTIVFSPEVLMKMYIDVYPTNGKAAVEFIADYQIDDDGEIYTYKMYSYYNEDTGEMIDSMDFSGFTFLWRAWWDGPRSVNILTYLGSGSDYNYMTIGWGNDDYGGVVGRHDSGNDQSIYTEYYNNKGGLVYQGYGNTNNNMDFSWYEQEGINIKPYFTTSKPDSITVIYDYWYVENPYSYGYSTYISNSSGGVSLLSNDYIGTFYYKAGLSWASGDCVYFYSDYLGEEEYTNGSTNGWRYYYSYVKGLEIPTPQNYFGDNYYFYSYWPLKYLTPDDKYSSYQITRKVTYEYAYTNEWEWDGSNYTYIYSWIDYDWWLDRDRDKFYSNTVDIDLNGILMEVDVYGWDDNYDIIAPQKSVFAYGTSDNPNYFKFTGTSIVNSVKSKIENLYNQFKNTDFVSYITNKTAPNPQLFPSP